MAWDPAQYERFRTEREQPFQDLLALVAPVPGMRIADLGCGTGETTRMLHDALQARETVGLDSSREMLAKAPSAPGLRFVRGSIEEFAHACVETPPGKFDLLFSNAALHWVPDHGALLRQLAGRLKPRGQLAVQVPCNEKHPSHRTALEVAREPRFRKLLGGFERHSPVGGPALYAARLHAAGFVEQHVRLQIYGHLLESREQVVEWVKGTLLTEYAQRLRPDDLSQFVERYRARLLPQLADERPYFFTYERLLLWGRLA